MNRPSRKSGEKHAFRDAVGVEVGETYHGLIEDRVQLLILNMTVRPFYVFLYLSLIGHLVGRFEMERLGSDGKGHAYFLEDRLILPPPKELVIDNGISTTHHVRIGMIRIVQNSHLL